MNHEAQWFNEKRWRTRTVLMDLVAAGARGGYWIGLVCTLGFALAEAVHGYEERSMYRLVGSLMLSVVARAVQRKTS